MRVIQPENTKASGWQPWCNDQMKKITQCSNVQRHDVLYGWKVWPLKHNLKVGPLILQLTVAQSLLPWQKYIAWNCIWYIAHVCVNWAGLSSLCHHRKLRSKHGLTWVLAKFCWPFKMATSVPVILLSQKKSHTLFYKVCPISCIDGRDGPLHKISSTS